MDYQNPFIFDVNFNFASNDLYNSFTRLVRPELEIGNFLLLDESDFLLLEGSDFLLL